MGRLQGLSRAAGKVLAFPFRAVFTNKVMVLLLAVNYLVYKQGAFCKHRGSSTAAESLFATCSLVLCTASPALGCHRPAQPYISRRDVCKLYHRNQ
jgi:hypothetical protein